MRAELRIKNLGSIEEARVDIKPLTIIAGKNGTGKTFITKGFYSILDALTKNLIKEKTEKILERLNNFLLDFKRKLNFQNIKVYRV